MRFEKVSFYPNAVLPQRSTKGAAGYDFTVLEDTLCPAGEVTYVPTGIKMQIDNGYFLQLSLRSSAPKKRSIMLANGIGIIDEDYYNSPDPKAEEGHIKFAIIPIGNQDVILKKGERIGQGVISKYELVDNDCANATRTGGFGSTDVLQNAT